VRPYYSDGSVMLFLGDCREILPRMTEGNFDVVITDPPYGDTSLQWDVPTEDWLPLLPPLLQPHASLWCFTSLRALLRQGDAFRTWQFAQDLVWEKHNGSNFHADRFKRVHEHIVQFYPPGTCWANIYKRPVTTPDATARTVRTKGRPPHMGTLKRVAYVSNDGGPRLMRSVLQVRSCHGYAEHETQKPLGIIAPLIEYSCPPNGVMLDPFAGSGSALMVAKLLGRRAVGIELQEEYAEIAARRLSQEVLPLEVG
jgi:site-specific DNA-methyltransferase (adenine-specific)